MKQSRQRRRTSRWALLAGLLSIVVVVAVRGTLDRDVRGIRRPSLDLAGSERHGEPVFDPGLADPSPTSGGTTATRPGSAEDARIEAQSFVRGRVRDATGKPLSGALVSSTPVLESFDRRWEDQVWEEVHERSVSTATDSRGCFQLRDDAADGAGVSRAMWVTHPDHEPELVIDPGNDVEVVMRSRSPITVHVIDGNGDDVTGATVRLTAGLVSDGFVREHGRSTALATRLFTREASTGSDGRCRLPRPTWHRALRAAKGGLQSRPDTSSSTEVELVLHEGYSIEGHVALDDGAEVPEGTRVHVSTATEPRKWLGSTPVSPSGEIESRAFSVGPEDEHWFRLFGGGLIAVEQRLPVPAPGERLLVEFMATSGETIQAVIKGTDGGPIPHARAQAWFDPGAGTTPWAYADGDGLVVMSGVPRAPFYVMVEAEDHADEFFGPYHCPDDTDDGPLELILKRSGRVAVRVLHGNEPVSDYQIVYWQNVKNYLSRDVEGAIDGVDVIDGLPTGRVLMFAASPEYPRSDTVEIEVKAGADVQVTLNLPEPITGVGTVTEGGTGLPIADASLTLYTNYGKQLMTEWAAFKSGPDGSFRIRGFPPGQAWMIVEAPGYAMDLVQGRGIPGEELDFGKVPLFKEKAIRIQLSSDTYVPFGAYAVSIDGARRMSRRSFEDDGSAVFEGCVAGGYTVQIEHPDGTWTQFRANVHEGEPWEIVHRLVAGTEVHVEVPGSFGIEDGEWVRLECRGPEEYSRTHYAPIRDGEAKFRGVAGSSATIVLNTEEGTVVGQVRLSPPGPMLVRLADVVDPVGFRLRDHRGRALSFARVWATPTDHERSWSASGITDETGRVSIGLPDCEEVSLMVRGTEGIAESLLVSLPPDRSREIDVQVDLGWTVTARFVDGGEPVSGVPAWLYGVESGLDLSILRPGADGIVRFSGLGPGRYRVVAGLPGYWFTEAFVEATESGDPIDVYLRRLGDVAMTVTDSEGPASGVLIELVDAHTGTSVQQWIMERRLDARGPLITDEEGHLHLRGLPHGLYQWRIEHDGEAHEGEFIVPAGAELRKRIRLL